MEVFSKGRRGKIILENIDWKKIAKKIAKSKEKKGAIKKEIQLLKKLNKNWIDFVPQIIDSGDDFFKYEFFEGKHFHKIFEKKDRFSKLQLLKQLVEKAYILDQVGIYHGELDSPRNNIIVGDDNEIFILDFERWRFINNWKKFNLRDIAQFMYQNGLLEKKRLIDFGKKDIEEIYSTIKRKLNIKLWVCYGQIWASIGWLVVLDQLTKYIVYNQWLGQNIFIFSKVLNKWIAWGIDLNIPFIFLGFIFAIWVAYLLFQKKYIGKYLFVLILAWGIGNFIDRLVFGGVRDFIDLTVWPVFNLADIYLTLSIMWIIYIEFILQDSWN